MTSVAVGIYGASGYAGAELLRLCAGHPAFDVALAAADSQAGTPVADLYPSLAAAYPGTVFADPDPAAAEGLDLVFLALPHGASQALVPDLRKRVGHVVDLRLFDVYRGGQLAAGRRSLAYRLRFQSLDHTLTDEEVAAVRRRCIDAVESAFPAQLRG